MSEFDCGWIEDEICDNCKYYDSDNDCCKKYENETVVEECFESKYS